MQFHSTKIPILHSGHFRSMIEILSELRFVSFASHHLPLIWKVIRMNTHLHRKELEINLMTEKNEFLFAALSKDETYD